MKKLDLISNKIKNSKPDYFGRGHFESIIKENSQQVLKWFEELIPVQEQIKEFSEMGYEDLQKRNYVRIITKLFPKEYAQFIAMNIMLRDIDSITAVARGIYDIRKQYETLLQHTRLKYPGKHQKYVDFHTYQQFISFYKDDLTNRAINFDIDKTIEIEPNQQYIYNVHAKKEEEEIKQEKEISNKEILEEQEEVEQEIKQTEEIMEEEEKEEIISKIEEKSILKPGIVQNETSKPNLKLNKDKTNWMKVLLKGV